MTLLCPCQSNLAYALCCMPYHKGTKHPETAEALMRARYSAYTRIDIAFIRKTMKPSASLNFSTKKVKHWARSAVWQSLHIMHASSGGMHDVQGTVTFEAYYKSAGQRFKITETSRFEKHLSQWFYVEAMHQHTIELDKKGN